MSKQARQRVDYMDTAKHSATADQATEAPTSWIPRTRGTAQILDKTQDFCHHPQPASIPARRPLQIVRLPWRLLRPRNGQASSRPPVAQSSGDVQETHPHLNSGSFFFFVD